MNESTALAVALAELDHLRRWAEERGFRLPDDDTPGAEVAGYAVLAGLPSRFGWAFDGQGYPDLEAARARVRWLQAECARTGSAERQRVAALVLLPEEA